MSWREVLGLLVVSLRTRIANAQPMPHDSDPVRNAERAGMRLALQWVIEDLDGVLKLGPHEAVKRVRKWGKS